MRILIVEDDEIKKNNILEVVDIDSQLSIDVARSVFAAKKLLLKKSYDLMILDINLPLTEEDLYSFIMEDNAGVLLYREIKDSDILLKPQHIILLTSFENLHQKYKDLIESGSFRIIKYNSFEESWKKEIQSKVRYLMQIETERLENREFDYYAALITATDVEYETFKAIVENPIIHKFPFDDSNYLIGHIKGEKDKRIVLLKQQQMGLTAASLHTIKLICNFSPKYVIMGGVCAGIKGAVNIGDVVIASEVVEFTSGKIIVAQDIKNSFKPEPKYISIRPELKEILNISYNDLIEKILRDGMAKEIFNIVYGPVVSGPFVLQNEFVIKEFILPHNRKIKALDMESYGVVYAGDNAFNPKPSVIICKAVSDFADMDKSKLYQEKAAINSALVVQELMLNYLP